MKSNSCPLCRLLLFAGLFYHGRLMSTDADNRISTDIFYTTAPESTELPSTPSDEPTVVATVYGNTIITDDEETEPSESPPPELTTILIYASPVLILVLLLPLIFCITRYKRKNKHIEDDPPQEDFKSPIFEEDTPSVMEIEMEDLDKWMNNIKKNNNRLSTLEEEHKLSTSVES
ncbi:transmembrane protein 154 isoform X2 [Pyxicephalus adspersus]|uniref:transmembrane protein 154 isoform X2 n=1 Tax=Pyxicephalus adspersus TaxID=30357 RepID=UPI003B5AC0BD